MNLSKAQRDVLEKMNAGWDLDVDRSFVRGVLLRRSGASQKVLTATFDSLFNRKLIEIAYKVGPLTIYRLTPAGRAALAAAKETT